MPSNPGTPFIKKLMNGEFETAYSLLQGLVEESITNIAQRKINSEIQEWFNSFMQRNPYYQLMMLRTQIRPRMPLTQSGHTIERQVTQTGYLRQAQIEYPKHTNIRQQPNRQTADTLNRPSRDLRLSPSDIKAYNNCGIDIQTVESSKPNIHLRNNEHQSLTLKLYQAIENRSEQEVDRCIRAILALTSNS